MNIDSLVTDLEETIHVADYGANIGGAPCGALWVLIAIFAAAKKT